MARSMGISVQEVRAMNAALGSEEDEEKMAEQYRAAFKVKLYWKHTHGFSSANGRLASLQFDPI